jgi:hypothetical protein
MSRLPILDFRLSYLHHLSVANGSLMELETHLLLLPRLSFFRRGSWTMPSV